MGASRLNRLIRQKDTVKFMQVIDRKIYLKLGKAADKRGISVQELLRAIIVPSWFELEEWPPPGREIASFKGLRLPKRRKRK